MSKVEIETDCAAFLGSIRNWNGQKPSFQSAVASAVYHGWRCESEGALQIVLAEHGLPLPRSTIARYASGTQPGPNVQTEVVAKLAAVVSELDAAERDARNRAVAAVRGANDIP